MNVWVTISVVDPKNDGSLLPLARDCFTLDQDEYLAKVLVAKTTERAGTRRSGLALAFDFAPSVSEASS